MWFAYYIFFHVFILSIVFYSRNTFARVVNKNNVFLFSFFFPLILLSALRYPKEGTDTVVYLDMFSAFSYGYPTFIGNPYFGLFEPGFLLVSKCISLITSNFQLYLLIFNVFFVYSCTTFIKSNSKSIWLSVFLFLGMGFFDQTMNVLRQFLALSIILWSYKYLLEKRKIQFVILVILASSFHLSAIIFIFAIFLDKLSLNKTTILIYIIVLITCFLFSGRIIQYILNNTGLYGQYLISDDFGIVAESKLAAILHLLIDLSILCFSLWGWKSTDMKNSSNTLMIKLLMIGSIFWALATNLGVLGRITAYFDIFAIILVPNLLFSLSNKTNKLISITLILVFFTARYFVIAYLRPNWFAIYPFQFYFDHI